MIQKNLNQKALRRRVWNWLPAFFEVAEVGSVVEASRKLHVTPAAVSRTLRLLEEELGMELFNRVGRTLVLNRAGAVFRDSLRGSFAAVDQGLTDVYGDPFSGRFRVSSLGALRREFVLPALIEMKRRHDALLPEHLNLRPTEANSMLLRGEISVAFHYEDISAPGLHVERLGETTMSIYCGQGHPLFEKSRVTKSDVQSHPFSVPEIGDSGRIMDGWPSELPRTIGMRISLLASNLAVCRSGALLTILPDVTAAPYVRSGELRRIAIGDLPPIEIFAVRHEATLDREASSSLVEDVRARIVEVNREVRALRRKRRSRKSKAAG